MSSSYLTQEYGDLLLLLISAQGELPTEYQNVMEGSLSILVCSENSAPTPVHAEAIARSIVMEQVGAWILPPANPRAWALSVRRNHLAKGLRNSSVLTKGIGFSRWKIHYDVGQEREGYHKDAVALVSIGYIVLREGD